MGVILKNSLRQGRTYERSHVMTLFNRYMNNIKPRTPCGTKHN